ncbi:hypothetical protein [Nocardia sp. NPDC051570]|uniref:hypothetical protein n=1 Tax=Nocardia sp. NPDC051570 TaxID=3364324 RepID=UPI0037B12922
MMPTTCSSAAAPKSLPRTDHPKPMPEIRLTPVTDTAPAAWLHTSLMDWERVAKDFPAYARILHPVTEIRTGDPVPWASVTRAFGPAHPDRMDVIIELAESDVWDQPEQGSLEQPHLNALLDILARHTTTPEHCYLGTWEGWQWYNPSKRRSGPVRALNPQDIPQEIRDQASFELPADRRYVLLRGPIRDAAHIGGHVTPRTLIMRSPNLLWPADHTWFVYTEIDDYETYISGSEQLIDELAASPLLEVEKIGTDHPDA